MSYKYKMYRVYRIESQVIFSIILATRVSSNNKSPVFLESCDENADNQKFVYDSVSRQLTVGNKLVVFTPMDKFGKQRKNGSPRCLLLLFFDFKY